MTEHDAIDGRIVEHYARPHLSDALAAALEAAGLADRRLTPDDLAPVDQFHTRGKAATLDLASRAGVTPDMHVLDLGGGVGGAARMLATRCGCRVEVLDLTAAYCAAGQMLTERSGLADRVRFRQGSATAPPYGDGQFDLVWSQHSTMNIFDMPQLLREARRVLRPGGRLAMHEILAGPEAGVYFPVPWAHEAACSSLVPPEELRAQAAAAGFSELAWHDETAAATEWFRRRVGGQAARGAPPLGLHLLLGPDAPAMFRNLLRNLEQGRIRVAQAVFARDE